MSYTKAEESILRIAAIARPEKLRRQTMLCMIGVVMVWIGAIAMIVDNPNWHTIRFAVVLAASFAAVFGFVQFRNRAISLIQKLQLPADSGAGNVV